MQQVRQIRFIVGGLLVVTVGLLGGLLAIPFLIGDPLTVVRPGAPALLADMNRGESAFMQLQVGGSGDLLLVVASPGTVDVPAIRFQMPNRTMPPVEADVEMTRPGVFQATGRLASPGRWQVVVDLGGGAAKEVEFVLAEF